MQNALLITLIGAGLVFVGLILLWIMMALLVRLTTQKVNEPIPNASGFTDTVTTSSVDIQTSESKARAAAAAVALAIALRKGSSSNPQTALVNLPGSWLQYHRGQQINRANLLARRKGK